MLDRLERKLGRFAIPNLTLFLVVGQAAAWILSRTRVSFIQGLFLQPVAVFRGEVWRLVSFMFMPPSAGGGFGDILTVIELLFLFWIGRTLEATWGDFRYNVYLLLGWLFTCAAAFIAPHQITTNGILMMSLLLPVGYLVPDAEIRLFFLIPIKMKWLALLTALGMAWLAVSGVLFGVFVQTGLVLAAWVPFFLFFGRDMVLRLRGRRRQRTRTRERTREQSSVTHRCTVCGLTDLDDPAMSFRYCSKCEGKHGYCADHIRDHEHVRG